MQKHHTDPMVMGSTGVSAGKIFLLFFTSFSAGKIFLPRRFCTAPVQVQHGAEGGHLAACQSACGEVLLPIFQSNIALLPGKTMWAQYYIKNYSTDWFCNIFLPEGDGATLLGKHFLMNLPIKTFSVRYLIWNKSRTRYLTIFQFCISAFSVFTFAYH